VASEPGTKKSRTALLKDKIIYCNMEKQFVDKKSQTWRWDREYRERGRLWQGPPHLDFDVPKGKVLELGCGNGKTLAALIRTGSAVTAIDSSPHAVELCKDLNADVRVADACALPFADNSFDAVIAFHVLEHVEDKAKAVAEARRVLKQGGVLLVRVFSTGDMRCGKGQATGEAGTFLRGKRGISYHYFTVSELRELMTAFKEKELRTTRRKVKYAGTEFVREMIEARYEKRQ
ncbi:MAG: class I SAM-dependent methyltransferase, partial [Candidatus Diapherotrites archaeon]|nr:class I SAM-dependent methyltransferase [Candidatus Diapherotrites archaeon]